MYLFEVGLGVAVAVGLFLAIGSYWLLARSLWPGLAHEAELRFSATPLTSVLTGFPVGIVVLIVNGALLAAPLQPVKAVGFVTTGLGLGFALAGATGMVGRIGRGLASPTDAGREWIRTLKAGAVLLLSCLLPVLGWFVILPIMLVGGLGTATLAIVRPLSRAAKAAEAHAPPP